MIDYSKITGFDWDEGNINKNWQKHKVSMFECEEVFFNSPPFLFEDIRHSQYEKRYYIIGETNERKNLYIIFTLRKNKIRIISARNMHKKEIEFYYKNRLNE